MKINRASHNRINAKLTRIGKSYHEHVPLGIMFGYLNEEGIIATQEDGTQWSGILSGKEGRATIDLAGPEGPIVNSMLVLSWYRMDSGRYEVVAGLS